MTESRVASKERGTTARAPPTFNLIRRKLRRFFVAHLVVGLQPIKQRCRFWIEAERFQLLDVPVAFLRIVIRICLQHFLTPSAPFLLAFRRPAAIDPFRDFIIAGASLDERFEIIALNALEPEEHVIERTIEMIFADVAPKQRTAFIDRAPQNGVAAHPRFRTARRFLCKVFPFFVHKKNYDLPHVAQGMMNAKCQPRAKRWYGYTKGNNLDNQRSHRNAEGRTGRFSSGSGSSGRSET